MKFPPLFLALLLAVSLPAQETTPEANRFERKLAQYDAQLAAGAVPAPGTAVVFYGSSTFTLWNGLEEAFPGVPVVNRGFGGSQYSDLVEQADRLVVPLKPAAVLFYCGGNDLASGEEPQAIAAEAEALVRRLGEALPEARFLVLTSKLAPKREALKEQVGALNQALRSRIPALPRAEVLDVLPLFLDQAGRPDPSLFREDRLHLNDSGNARLRDFLAPHLARFAPGA